MVSRILPFNEEKCAVTYSKYLRDGKVRKKPLIFRTSAAGIALMLILVAGTRLCFGLV